MGKATHIFLAAVCCGVALWAAAPWLYVAALVLVILPPGPEKETASVNYKALEDRFVEKYADALAQLTILKLQLKIFEQEGHEEYQQLRDNYILLEEIIITKLHHVSKTRADLYERIQRRAEEILKINNKKV